MKFEIVEVEEGRAAAPVAFRSRLMMVTEIETTATTASAVIHFSFSNCQPHTRVSEPASGTLGTDGQDVADVLGILRIMRHNPQGGQHDCD